MLAVESLQYLYEYLFRIQQLRFEYMKPAKGYLQINVRQRLREVHER